MNKQTSKPKTKGITSKKSKLEVRLKSTHGVARGPRE